MVADTPLASMTCLDSDGRTAWFNPPVWLSSCNKSLQVSKLVVLTIAFLSQTNSSFYSYCQKELKKKIMQQRCAISSQA